jgi:NADP-dependent 3-hydroxy acid dehydrogenase YdfG
MSAGAASFEGRLAVITGATGAIGGAIARALAGAGATLVLLGRDPDRLAALADQFDGRRGQIRSVHCIDFAGRDNLQAAAAALAAQLPAVDLFIHCAGTIEPALIERMAAASWERQFDVNLRAAFVLTQALLPLLRAARGQVAFINTTAVHQPPRRGLSAYTAAKGALRVLADTLRAEVNAQGVRVISLYPGRTASRMQQAMHAAEGRRYRPEILMQPDDVARSLLDALALPRSAEITDLSIRPFQPQHDGPQGPNVVGQNWK